MITQDTYRIYFDIPKIDHSDEEKIKANQDHAQILYFTTMTNDGLMVFTFEDKVENINSRLFVELAKNIKINSEAWSQLIQFTEKNLLYEQDDISSKLPQVFGLILYASISPEHREDVFNNLCPLLLKSKTLNQNMFPNFVQLLQDCLKILFLIMKPK